MLAVLGPPARRASTSCTRPSRRHAQATRADRPFFLRMSVKPRVMASAFCATAVASSVPMTSFQPPPAGSARRRAGAGHAAGGRRGDAAAGGHRERHDEHVGGGGAATPPRRRGANRRRPGAATTTTRRGSFVGARSASEHAGGVAAELDAQRRHRRARAQPLEPRVARLQVAPPHGADGRDGGEVDAEVDERVGRRLARADRLGEERGSGKIRGDRRARHERRPHEQPHLGERRLHLLAKPRALRVLLGGDDRRTRHRRTRRRVERGQPRRRAGEAEAERERARDTRLRFLARCRGKRAKKLRRLAPFGCGPAALLRTHARTPRDDCTSSTRRSPHHEGMGP